MKYIKVDKENIKKMINENVILVFAIKKSRLKAKQLAILEVACLLEDYGITFIRNGPLGDVKGVFSFFVSREKYMEIQKSLKYLGYSDKVYLILFDGDESINESDISSINDLKWKNYPYQLYDFFEQDSNIYYKQSPDVREFMILDYDDNVKEVHGYRGDGSELGRRALPVEDSRCIVNLTIPSSRKSFLDPFAGGGGIIYQAKYINRKMELYSIDIDKKVAPGLEHYGSTHCVGDSSLLEFKEDYYDAIATEVPFSVGAIETITCFLEKAKKALKRKGIIILMCGSNQTEKINTCLMKNYTVVISKKVNRKGTDVNLFIAIQDDEFYNELILFADYISTIY